MTHFHLVDRKKVDKIFVEILYIGYWVPFVDEWKNLVNAILGRKLVIFNTHT